MKKRRVQNFSEIGGAFEVLPGGGGKNSNFGKGAIFKVSVCNESKTIFNLARSKIAGLGLQNIILNFFCIGMKISGPALAVDKP